MKYIIIVFLFLITSACKNQDNTELMPENVTEAYNLTDELKNCKVFKIPQKNGYGIPLFVFKCENKVSAVSAQCGKGCFISTNIID